MLVQDREAHFHFAQEVDQSRSTEPIRFANLYERNTRHGLGATMAQQQPMHDPSDGIDPELVSLTLRLQEWEATSLN